MGEGHIIAAVAKRLGGSEQGASVAAVEAMPALAVGVEHLITVVVPGLETGGIAANLSTDGGYACESSWRVLCFNPHVMALAALLLAALALLLAACALCCACRQSRAGPLLPVLAPGAPSASGATQIALELTDRGRSQQPAQIGGSLSFESFHSLSEGDAGTGHSFRSYEDEAICANLSFHLEQRHGVSFGNPGSLEVEPDRRMALGAPAGMMARPSAVVPGQPPPPLDLNGCWKCVATWGLDEFLKSMGVSRVKRCAASKSAWPSWEFYQAGNEITFINHTVMGDISEVLTAGGKEYEHRDLSKQVQICKAYWDRRALVIERRGPQGPCREVRSVREDGALEFVLHAESLGCSWGRRFVRASCRPAAAA